MLIAVPDSLRQPCPRTPTAEVNTVQELAAFSVKQEADLKTCDARRAAAIAIIDAANAQRQADAHP